MSDSDRFLLDPDERRVIGVLIEKSLTTPAYYPLTINAMVTGCNQKSNRDPVVEFVDDEIDEILLRLQRRGLASEHYGAGGRTVRWRQEFTKELELDGQQMAVVAELLLRGPQTLGELRTRASRMKAIPDLGVLQSIVTRSEQMTPPRMLRLSSRDQKRGVRYAHGFYPEAEIAEIRALEGSGFSAAPPPRQSVAFAPAAPAVDVVAELREEIAGLSRRVSNLEQQLGIHSSS